MEQILRQIKQSTTKTLSYFINDLNPEGGFNSANHDLCCYYKAPMMFINATYTNKARNILDFIHHHFMTHEGDFLTNSQLRKSSKPEYNEYWIYTNGWIIRSANKLGDSRITNHGYTFILRFHNSQSGIFITHDPNSYSPHADILTNSQCGLLSLEMGDLDYARQSAQYLIHIIHNNKDMKHGLYLRTDLEFKPIEYYDESMKPFYFLSLKEPYQLYFMIGYPIAFLTLIYQQTGNSEYLTGAHAYANFALNCHPTILKSDSSHKLAWGLSLLNCADFRYEYEVMISAIINHFYHSQGKTGLWHGSCVNTAYDQSAEIACWLNAIKSNLHYIKQNNS